PLENLLDSGSSDTVEMEMEALGRFFLVRCTPMHDEDGRVVRVIHIATDITERRQAEEALRDSEERSRALLNAFPDIAVLVDTDFRYLAANEPAAEALGMRPRDMLGRRVEDLLPAGAGAGRAARGREVLRTGEPVEFEDEMFGRNFVNSAYPVFDDKGEVSGLAVFCQDITERRRLEEQLRQSQKMEAIGQLAAGIAHEFNNLMAVVINYSDLAGEGLRPGDPALDDLRHIKIAGERAATLTKQILTFSRRQIIAPRVLDLNRIVLGQERMLRRVVGENVELVTRLDPDLGGVKADPGQLEQVLINLALNARDAMPQGGRLVMSTSNVDLDEGVTNHDLDAELTPGRYVRLSVEDTGTGIDPEILPKIFDPFFTTKDRATHNGLGLSTVYGMVTQAGGGLKVENEPGRGATFHLYLPPSDEPVDRSEDAPPPAWPLETILVVEDEPMVRKMIRRVLETTGYRVLSAANGQEALASAERHGREIHLLLTDVVMPGESGPRVAARLKTGHPGLKVIYVSGYPEDIVVRHGVFPGEVHLISKPFSPEDLVRKIRRVLDKTG
ncbi:MAG: PAS domain-containing protein, partial [Proteobacteria bacterium]|nr:PAS domain-containing protein [Pseudomonadota bacterium]